MFSLRKIIENSQTNYVLGIQYQVIERESDYEKFREIFSKSFNYEHAADLDEKSDDYTKNCYAFIVTNDFEPIPLYKNQKNYIMTESGKTFSNLTYKLKITDKEDQIYCEVCKDELVTNLIKDCIEKVNAEVPFGKEDAYDMIVDYIKKIQ